jgi:quercetin dioxygenase-like cupin family protein
VDVTTQGAGTGATVLTAADVAARAEEPLGRLDGVRHRVLWRDAESMAGVLTVAAGHRLGLHTHRVNHHHMWVLDGHATIVGTEAGPGSYAHVPSGIEHDIDATATEGCTVFYLYIRPGG